MNVARIVLRNVAASWIGLGSQLLVTFLLTPFVIRQLGMEAYGVWLLLQGIVGYYGLVDMGLRAGLTQSITRRIAAQDHASIRRHIAAAIPVLVGLSGIILLLSAILGLTLPKFVSMDDSLGSMVWMVVIIQAIGVAANLPLTPYSAVLVGLQRYDLANLISITTKLLMATLTYLMLSAGGGLLALSAVLAFTNFWDAIVRVLLARWLVPEIRGAGICFDRTELSEISNVGIWNFLIGISRRLIYFSDTVTVAILFSAKAVAPFGIAAMLVDYGNQLVIASTKVLFPTMAHLRHNGNIELQRHLYITATRLTVGFSLTILVVGATWLVPFLRLWLSDTPEKELVLAQAPSIFAVLAVASTFVGFQRAGMQLMLANEQLKLLATLLFSEALLNVVFSILCGWWLGPLGIAVGTLIPAAILGLGFHVPIHAKTLKCTAVYLFTAILPRPMLYGALLGLAIKIFQFWLGTPSTWGELILVGGMSSLISIAALFPLLLTSQQILQLKGIATRKATFFLGLNLER